MALTINQLVHFRSYHRQMVHYFNEVLTEELTKSDREYYRLCHQMHTHRYLMLDRRLLQMEFEQKEDITPDDLRNFNLGLMKIADCLKSVEQFLFSNQ